MTLTLPDGRELPAGTVYCIGRNYAAHVTEMGDVPAPAPDEAVPDPVVFIKPASSLVANGGTVVLPRQSSDVHHELELVAVIGAEGKDIVEAQALNHVAAYALGLDLTARDVQAAAKKAGTPWAIAKGFDTFAPLGDLVDAGAVGDPQTLEIRLDVNGETRQHGTTDQMMRSVARCVAFLSTVFRLRPGDLVYTGTPEGVGPLAAGDRLLATGTCADGAPLPDLVVTVEGA